MSVRPIEFAFPGPLRDRLLSAIERGEREDVDQLTALRIRVDQ